jgi:peptidoglycan/LPS O-acetylase OafA/YrhL
MKERLAELDILRGIAFILVVVQHTIGGYSFSENISYRDLAVSRGIYIIAQPAVKIFLILMGMVLVYTYLDKFNYKTFYIKKIKFLIIPYVIFSILDACLLKDWEKFRNIFAQIVTGNTVYHFWYMGMAFRIYLYFPIIIIIIRTINKKSGAFKINFLFVYSAIYVYLLKNNNMISSFVGKLIFENPDKLQQRFINISPLNWSLYFVIGVYIILNYEKFKNMTLKYGKVIVILYMLSTAVVYCRNMDLMENYFWLYNKLSYEVSIVNNILCMMFFYVISLYITRKRVLSSVFKFVGRYSFPSYMFHIVVLQHLANNIPQTKYLYSPFILFILTVIITTAIFYFISFLPFSRYIAGIKEKFNFSNCGFYKSMRVNGRGTNL